MVFVMTTFVVILFVFHCGCGW